MILLLLLLGLLFSFSAAISSDTGLMCAIDMGSNTFRLIVGEMKVANTFSITLQKTNWVWEITCRRRA